MKQLISSGSVFEQKYGHSRAVRVGDTIYVSGTTGYEYATGTLPPDAADQTRQTFRNIEAALARAGVSLADLVQLVTYFTDAADWDAIGAVLRDELQGIHPANSGVQVRLIDPAMKVEISAIAVRSR
jgi:2-iminobutanoate/2-iminopropanoate deaminase